MRRRIGLIAPFLRLPRDERRMVLVAAARLAVARLGVRLAGVARTRRLVGRQTFRGPVEPERGAELVRMASAALPGATLCLPRAIALEALLIEADHPAELRIGIAPDQGPGQLSAHAWVELRGVAVAEDASRYTALPVFGARA